MALVVAAVAVDDILSGVHQSIHPSVHPLLITITARDMNSNADGDAFLNVFHVAIGFKLGLHPHNQLSIEQVAQWLTTAESNFKNLGFKYIRMNKPKSKI